MHRKVSGFPLVFPVTALFLISLMLGAQLALPVRGQSTPVDDGGHIFLPVVLNGPDTPDPGPDREWDPRLDQRGAVLIEATVTPGQGYWRLVKARWYNTEESAERHNIYVDLLDGSGERQVDAPVLITWPDGSSTIVTKAKPGEEYAADFPMFSLAPAYAAQPYDGAPADIVDGMGMGEIDDPYHAHHTSYGLVWQWTTADVSPTITPTATVTPTVSPTATPTITPTATVTSTITPTITVTPTITPAATLTPIPTPTFTPTPMPNPGYVFSRADVESCLPGDSGTRVEGVVYYNDQPADGYDIVFSWQPDGEWSTPPTTSGPNPPGAYTHIINASTGDWWVWIVGEAGARISPMATFTVNEACRVATVNFYGP